MRYIPYIILSLIVIGLGYQLLISPLSIVGPLLIAGVVYYLYRYPPQWLIRITSQTPNARPKKNKKYPFRVYSGKK